MLSATTEPEPELRPVDEAVFSKILTNNQNNDGTSSLGSLKVNNLSLNDNTLMAVDLDNTCINNYEKRAGTITLEPAKAKAVEEKNSSSALLSKSVDIKRFVKVISQVPGMQDVFFIEEKKATARIKPCKRQPEGYRFHPFTINLLCKYHTTLIMMETEPFAHELLLQLVALLVQDSSAAHVDDEVWSILCNGWIKPTSFQKDTITKMVEEIAFKNRYGPGLNKIDAFIWEVRDPTSILPPFIADAVLEDRKKRTFYSNILLSEYQKDFTRKSTNTPLTTLAIEKLDEKLNEEASEKSFVSIEKPIVGLERIDTSLTDPINDVQPPTPVNQDHEKPTSSLATARASRKQKNSKGMAKLSLFFNIIKKDFPTDLARTEDDSSLVYFQPFFIKPNVAIAPVNYFSDHYDIDIDNDNVISYFKTKNYQRIKTKLKRPYCRCIGYDSRPILAIAKLIQFHENYRPAYFGTLCRPKHQDLSHNLKHQSPANESRSQSLIHGNNLSSQPTCNPRNPFERKEGLDYEYDSDDDWGDDAEIDDAESISDSENSDEEEETQDLLGSSLASEDDRSWLVPDGYISEDEGGEKGSSGVEDDGIDGAGGKRRKKIFTMAELDNQDKTRHGGGPKRRYIEKDLIIFGPFIDGEIDEDNLPVEIKDIFYHWNETCPSEMGIDPFFGITFETTVDSRDLGIIDTRPVTNISDEMLPELATLVNGSKLGVSKLLGLFSVKHGRLSKRQFEFRLNQIASKIRSDPSSKSFWSIRPEFNHLLLPFKDSNENNEQLVFQV